MRLRYKALILLFLALTWRTGLRGAGGQYDPPPLPDFPDMPLPDDPPDLFTDPFDPTSGAPDPMEIPFPPEDPFDPIDIPFPDPCLPMIPDPPDDLDFPDIPLPDPFDEVPGTLDDLPDLPLPPPPEAHLQPRAAANVTTRFMPFPLRLPFHPAYSGVSAPKTTRPCIAASATTLIVAESSHNDLLFLATCPYAVIQRVTVGTKPLAARATPDGQFVWVPNYGSASVSIVSVSTKTVVATISLPAFNGNPAKPNRVVFTPDGSLAYVTNYDANPGSVVFAIDVPNRRVVATIPIGAKPGGAAVTPDGASLWVTNRGSGNLTVIDTMTNTVVTQVAADFPAGIAFNPTGTRAYVAESEPSGNGYLRVFDASTAATVARIQVGGFPHVVRVTPSGHHIFVTNLVTSSISEISPITNTVIATIALTGKHPVGLAFVR